MKMKGIWKHLATLTIMAALVLCLLPLGASAEGLSGDSFPTSPVNGFTFSAELWCKTCDQHFNYGQNDNEHQFTINSFGYTIANGTYSFTISYSVKACGFEETKENPERTATYDCSNGVNMTHLFRDASSPSNHYTVSVNVTRPITAHSFDQAAGDGKCKVCGYVCSHSNKTAATCTAAEKCNACGMTFGEINSDAHDYIWTYENGNHNGVCSYNDQHKKSGNCEPGEDGNCTVCHASLVASVHIPNKILYFTDADAALKYADDYYADTVTILKDATVNRGTVAGNLVVNSGVTLTFSGLSGDTESFARVEEGNVSGGGTIGGRGVTLEVEGGCSGCTFDMPVWNYGTITGGIFNKVVENYGTITGGTFENGIKNYGTIKGGKVYVILWNAIWNGENSEVKTGTVYADDIKLGSNFNKYIADEGTTLHCKHTHATAATCMKAQTCPFGCTGLAGIDSNAHSLSYTVADKVITETCAHGCTHSATATLDISTDSVTYNGAAQTIATVAHSGTWLGERLTAQYENNTNVGTATVYIQAGEAKAVKTFAITKATPTLEHFDITLPQNAVYDGTEKAATIDPKAGVEGMGEVSIKYYQGEKELNETPTNAGTYTVEFTVTEGSNYLPAKLLAGSFNIAKAEAVKTAPTAAAESFVYNGTAQALTTAGTPNGDNKIFFWINTEDDYSETVLTATDAGTYTVKWYAGEDGDPNYNPKQGEITVTIAKADAITTAPTANTLTYNSKPQQLVSGGISNWGSIEYKLDNGDWSYSIPTATNAGSYTVYYRIQLGENFNNVAETAIPVELAPFNFATATAGNAKIGLLGTPFVYDGTAKTGTPSVVVTLPSADPGSSSIEVNLTEGTDFTVDYENNVKAGTFTATFTGNGNYTGVVTRNYEIAKAPLTLTVKDQAITYGESIDQAEYTVTGLATGDKATVTLTPSTANISKSGSISAEITIKNAAGEDVTESCYTIADSAASLTIDPDLSAIENLKVETVHYSSRDAIEKTQEMLNDAENDVKNDDNITNALQKCANLLVQIDASLDAQATDAINATLKTTASNVKLADKATVTKAIADIAKAKTDYAGNYSEADIAALDAQTAKLNAALEAIANAEEVIALMNALPADVEPDDAKAIEAKAEYDKLTSNEKNMVASSAATKLAALTTYKIVKGDKATWEKGKTLTFTINGDINRFKGVKVGNSTVNAKYYTAKAGSTIVTLEKSFFEQKSISSKAAHTITFLFNDGEVRGTFNIHKDAMTPATGDNSNIFLWGGVALISLLGAGAMIMLALKKKNKHQG